MIYLTLFLTFLQIGAQGEPYSASLHTARHRPFAAVKRSIL